MLTVQGAEGITNLWGATQKPDTISRVKCVCLRMQNIRPPVTTVSIACAGIRACKTNESPPKDGAFSVAASKIHTHIMWKTYAHYTLLTVMSARHMDVALLGSL